MIPRFKTTGLIDGTTPSYNQIKYRCSAAGPLNAGTSVTSRYVKETYGFDIENYHKRKASGELLPMTPFNQTEYTASRNCTAQHLGADVATNCGRLEYHKAYPYAPNFPIAYNAAIDFEIPDTAYYVQQAAAKIYSRGHDTLTFIAELKKTREMFQNVSKKLLSLRDGLSLKRASDLWLEARYGWRTLVYDLEDLHQALSELGETRKRYSERTGQTLSEADSYVVVSDNGVNVITDTYSTSLTISVRGSVVADISPPTFQFDPVQTAWELTRLSFVVDWLINVGQSISAIEFLIFNTSYSAAGGYSATKEISVSRVLSTSPSNLISTYSGAGTSKAKKIWTARVPTSVSYLPLIKLRLDEFKVLDLLALLRQAI